MTSEPERASDAIHGQPPQPTAPVTASSANDQATTERVEASARKTRTLTSSQAVTRRTSAPTQPTTDAPTRALSDMRTTRAPAASPTTAERQRALAAINADESSNATIIPGARKYRRPARIVPRRSGPRSAVAQFAVSTIATALVAAALALSTPLGHSTGLNLDTVLNSYAGAAAIIPTPTPTTRPTPTPSFRPPSGANPGQQAVINNIVAVFGGYSAGALAVSKCESGYDPNAWNSYPILGSHASGVFQILYPSTWNSTSYASYSPFNADANIRAAYQIFKRDGYSWREWQCQP
ncbi:MAG: hypothetical protein KGO05_10525 [Chloroflexota bacterium]|nr:hypothetical protein [Chloroflexota bacterium]